MKQKKSFLNSMILAMQKNKSWCGETHIQKNVYLLKELFNEKVGFDFILYKHGPYSFELKDALQELIAIEDLTLTSNGNYGPSYFVLESSECIKDDEKLINEIEYVARITGTQKVSSLEKMSTALFVIKNYSELDDDKKAEKFHKLKPHISVEAALEAINDMNEIIEETRSQ